MPSDRHLAGPRVIGNRKALIVTASTADNNHVYGLELLLRSMGIHPHRMSREDYTATSIEFRRAWALTIGEQSGSYAQLRSDEPHGSFWAFAAAPWDDIGLKDGTSTSATTSDQITLTANHPIFKYLPGAAAQRVVEMTDPDRQISSMVTAGWAPDAFLAAFHETAGTEPTIGLLHAGKQRSTFRNGRHAPSTRIQHYTLFDKTGVGDWTWKPEMRNLYRGIVEYLMDESYLRRSNKVGF